ncbi:MAG: ABC transporter ATP-binding protein [Bacteroidota bacterium]
MKHPLQIKDLCIGYGNKIIAKDLNLHVEKGELLCLIGPNGAGKSTLLKSISSLQKKLGGSVLLNGEELEKMSTKELARKISLVLTERVDSNLNVYSLVSMGRYPYTAWTGRMKEEDKAFIQRAIKETGLKELASRPLYQLSDGERQKAMIAKALAQDTPLILLDEPTAHLDIPNRMELLSLLRRLTRAEGKTILLSIHDLEAALQIADRVWLMDGEGKIEAGIPEELILKGKVQKIFSAKDLEFDMQVGSFRLLQSSRAKVFIEGMGIGKIWTIRALLRLGYELTEKAQEARFEISIESKEDQYQWRLIRHQKEQEFTSLSALLGYLEKS